MGVKRGRDEGRLQFHIIKITNLNQSINGSCLYLVYNSKGPPRAPRTPRPTPRYPILESKEDLLNQSPITQPTPMTCRANSTTPGNFDCLYGSTCDYYETGACVCREGYRHDQILFHMKNCGIPINAAYPLFSLAIFVSLLTSFLTGRQASRMPRRSPLRTILVYSSCWVLIAPILVIVVWSSDLYFGPGGIVLLIAILQVVNVAVVLVDLRIVLILLALKTPGRTREAQAYYTHFQYAWLAGWSLLRFCIGVAMMVGEVGGRPDVYRASVFAIVVELLGEVMCNMTRQIVWITQILKGIKGIYSLDDDRRRAEAAEEAKEGGVKKTSTTRATLAFAKRLLDSRIVGVIYTVVFGGLCLAFVVLYARYEGYLPHFWIIASIMLITWPMIALIPFALARDVSVKEIEETVFMEEEEAEDEHGSPGTRAKRVLEEDTTIQSSREGFVVAVQPSYVV